jgi:hypothetical protein
MVPQVRVASSNLLIFTKRTLICHTRVLTKIPIKKENEPAKLSDGDETSSLLARDGDGASSLSARQRRGYSLSTREKLSRVLSQHAKRRRKRRKRRENVIIERNCNSPWLKFRIVNTYDPIRYTYRSCVSLRFSRFTALTIHWYDL